MFDRLFSNANHSKKPAVPPVFSNRIEFRNFRTEVSKFRLSDSTVNVCVPDKDARKREAAASRLQAFILECIIFSD
jgi:hypothetical protein